MSLIITACWIRHLYPDLDCCKIWARDENNKPIPGSYSIRSEDEGVTIPIMAKHDLCEGFCSDNSGMQGSRAIEKMRGEKRINVNFSSTQRTIFDLELFAKILNKLHEGSPEDALNCLKYIISIALEKQANRATTNSQLLTEKIGYTVSKKLLEASDPEIVKCVAGACISLLYNPFNITVTGIESHKTASDSRSGKSGDLQCMTRDGREIFAFEVKAKSIELDWQNINRARRSLSSSGDLDVFFFIHESCDFRKTTAVREFLESNYPESTSGKIQFISLPELVSQVEALSSPDILFNHTTKLIAEAPSISTHHRAIWAAP